MNWKNVGTSTGTADFWKDWEDVQSFSGVGSYETTRTHKNFLGFKCNRKYLFEIIKHKKVAQPKDLSNKAHPSAHKYGYGQMFFGNIRREARFLERFLRVFGIKYY